MNQSGRPYSCTVFLSALRILKKIIQDAKHSLSLHAVKYDLCFKSR